MTDTVGCRFDRSPLVDRNVSFVNDAVDHFGNTPPDDASEGDAVIESGPYAGQSKGAGSRFDFWLPEDGGLEDLDVGDDMPGWLRTMVAGERLIRP